MFKEYILKEDITFRNDSMESPYKSGKKFRVKEEIFTSYISGGKKTYYYVYSEDSGILDHFDNEGEFFEIFMTIEESRDKKIDQII